VCSTLASKPTSISRMGIAVNTVIAVREAMKIGAQPDNQEYYYRTG